MQKSRLGFSVGLLGAIIYLLGIMNTTIFFLAIVYVLLKEDNIWLKKTVVKAMILLFAFSILTTLFSSGTIILNGMLHYIIAPYIMSDFILNILNFFEILLNIAEKLVFIILAFLALKQGTIKIPVLDNFINEQMDKNI